MTATTKPKSRRRTTKPVMVFNFFGNTVPASLFDLIPSDKEINQALKTQETQAAKVDKPAKVEPATTRQEPQQAIKPNFHVVNHEENVYATPNGIYWYTTRSGHTKQFAAIKFNRQIAGGRVLLFYYDPVAKVAYWPKFKMTNGNAGFWTAEHRLGHSFNEAIANSR